MKTTGTILVGLSLFIAFAAFAERFGPVFRERGIPLSGSVMSAWLFLPLAVVLFVAGMLLRRPATRARALDEDGSGAT